MSTRQTTGRREGEEGVAGCSGGNERPIEERERGEKKAAFRYEVIEALGERKRERERERERKADE